MVGLFQSFISRFLSVCIDQWNDSHLPECVYYTSTGGELECHLHILHGSHDLLLLYSRVSLCLHGKYHNLHKEICVIKIK